MKRSVENGVIVLVPDEGFKYITNGCVTCKKVYLSVGDFQTAWRDTNEEPVEPKADEDLTAEEALEIITGGNA